MSTSAHSTVSNADLLFAMQGVLARLAAIEDRLGLSELSPKPYLKIQEAAKITGLAAITIRRAVKSGSLPCVRKGTVYRIKRTELDVWIAANH